MSTNTWTQYVAMDEPAFEPHAMQAALDACEDWDDEVELGEGWTGDDADFEDLE